MRGVGADLGTLFDIPPIKVEALKNHVLERRRWLGECGIDGFDRLNCAYSEEGMNVDYYDQVGIEFCETLDEWFNRPSMYVKWEEQYDEPIPEV